MWSAEMLDRGLGVRARTFRLGSLVLTLAIASGTGFVPPLAAQQGTNGVPAQPLAVFQGQPITAEDLPAKEQAQLLRMMQQVYGVQMRALHETLDHKLIEAEAKRRGITAEELFKAEVAAKVTPPTDEEVDAYYKDHQVNFPQPPVEAKAKIRQGMLNDELQKRQVAYAQELLTQALNSGDAKLLIRPPKNEVTADPARVRGDGNAPITIVEFSDFSCPYCRGVEGTLGELLSKYPGRIKIAYRDFPLIALHPNAEAAAEASRCAGEQSKFWEYHDALFSHSDKQTHDDLVQYARDLNLDGGKFDECLRGGRYKAQVNRDLDMGIRSGVVATPAFFVNGTFVSGAQPASAFEKIIEEELANGKQKSSGPASGTTTASIR